MSSSNTILKKLAKERENRNAPVVEAWSCPVCYTDGSSSGHVIPKCCTHKICLDCYSNILTKTTNCICPVCRSLYRPNNPEITAVNQEPVANIVPRRKVLIITDNFYFGSVGSIRIQM
jgi:hypothetical protein